MMALPASTGPVDYKLVSGDGDQLVWEPHPFVNKHVEGSSGSAQLIITKWGSRESSVSKVNLLLQSKVTH